MKKTMFFLHLLSYVYQCSSLELDEAFDTNDVENRACQFGCASENVRKSSVRETHDKLHVGSECATLFEKCIKYRTCQENCVPEMPVLPYLQFKKLSQQVRPPLNPCLDLVTSCNYESMDSYEILRTENPFLYI